MLKKISSLCLALILAVVPFTNVLNARAAVSNWQKGVTFFPNSAGDYASDSFRESLGRAQAAGATHVALVIPYYQSNIFSTDIGSGWNTPSDEALAAGIDYAHSLGMKVMLKPHAESYGGEWRAQINPGDRDGWFTNYGNLLVHLGTIGQAHGVEIISLGTELVSMAIRNNSGNTEHWQTMIGQVRAVFSGQLTYGANSTNNSEDPFSNEKKFIDFWPQLDFVGLSAYYSLDSRNYGTASVDSLKASWDGWNNNDIKAFAQSVGKPVVFTEIGYRSLTGAHVEPWNWAQSGSSDQQEQANDYRALLEYWNDYGYMQGVYWWYWDMNPNGGGNGDTGYTPQNKLAEGVLAQWFGTPPPPTGGGSTTPAAFMADGSANPASPTAGQSVTATITVHNTGGAANNLVTDIEVYDKNNNRVLQKFNEGESFAANSTKSYTVNWTASGGDMQFYRVAVGVFTGGWSQNVYWNNEALKVVVQPGGSTGDPTTGPATTNIWWPTNGAAVVSTQPFKAMLEGRDISTYRMFWQVDGGQLNPMSDSSEDYPHKEAWVDVSNWRWQPSQQYQLNFVSQDLAGTPISERAVTINVQ
jgi:hypothetical protein